MELSIIIVTNNSEKWVGKVIKRLNAYRNLPTVQFVFIDNLSKDQSVPIIVGNIGTDFTDEERYKFYINTKPKKDEEINSMISKIASSEKCVIIKENMNRKKLDKLIKEQLK